jgi:predicted nucleic acid-binding Zn ribbon protein
LRDRRDPEQDNQRRRVLAVAAIATETAAAATSDPISTRRRSNRSPIQPAPGADATDATTLEKIAADTHKAEPVSP